MHVEHPAYVIAYFTEIYDTITCITSIEVILGIVYIHRGNYFGCVSSYRDNILPLKFIYFHKK